MAWYTAPRSVVYIWRERAGLIKNVGILINVYKHQQVNLIEASFKALKTLLVLHWNPHGQKWELKLNLYQREMYFIRRLPIEMKLIITDLCSRYSL